MDEQNSKTNAADSLELRADLDAVLASKNLMFAKDLDDGFRNDLRTSWRKLARARGGILSSADIHDTIQSYLHIGLVTRPPLPGQNEKPTLRTTLPEEVAQLLKSNIPHRPTTAEGPVPTIATLTVPRGTNAQLQHLPRAMFGSFSNEFGSLTFESRGAEGRLQVFSVAHVDARFAKLVAMLAEDHIALVLMGDRRLGGGQTRTGGKSFPGSGFGFGTDALLGDKTPDEGRRSSNGGNGGATATERLEMASEHLEVWGMQAVEELPEGDALKTMSADLLDAMLQRLRVLPEPSAAPHHAPRKATRPQPSSPQRLRLTSVDDMARYLACMEDTLPANIRTWAYQNLELARNDRASKEERRHATRSLSLVLGVQWAKPPFKRVDPARARAILDQQLFGLDAVKQRVVETIVQINRTHTLPLYGLLLAGPAGVGKSQIAYATARILNLPWASLDMSAIRDLAGLIGSDRVYSNAKPGRVMEALAHAGSANMVLVINELDKANEGGQNGSSADALLTLFDNLGFTDNYIECSVPTDGIYPIATANELDKISAPLLSRFEVIEIPDYTPEEKRVILREYSLHKVLAHMGLRGEEFSLTDAALDCVIERYHDESGCRSLEKAAEHLAAHALFLLESDPALAHVSFDAPDVQALLDA